MPHRQEDGPESDADIIAEVTGGNREAYARIVRRHHDRLRSILSFYCRSAEAVEEHLQNAFVQAYVNLDKYDAGAAFLPWLKTIALNCLRDEFRRRKASVWREKDYVQYRQAMRLAAGSEAEEAEAKRAALKSCLKKLPDDHTELLRAKYTEGRPAERLAGEQGLTVSALKVRLLRIRQALKECISRQLRHSGGTTA
ncbi:MAG: sigma-70 family RNA polymerase sigma factor [Planctomycetes bacterium]|nr:sigma-70 family RNA polymerase sigma factor [Planctomycetota bacterium]